MELLLSAPIVAFVIYLFYTWFGVLNRHLIFLYHHVMGPGFDTTPFGWVTVGRYWMSGLVASGAVMVPYIGLNLVLGRVVRSFRAPVWWRLWLLCAIPLVVAVPAVVMTVNEPVLPFRHAIRVTGVLLVGLAVAVRLGETAASHPLRYVLLMLDGVALACLLMSLRAAESYRNWISRGGAAFIHRFLLVFAVGIGLLFATTVLHAWWRWASAPDPASLFVAGLGVHYLFLPLYHHLCWCKDNGSWTDPDYFCYIPSADNYFSRNSVFQLAVWLVVGLVALCVARLRCRLAARGTAAPVVRRGIRRPQR